MAWQWGEGCCFRPHNNWLHDNNKPKKDVHNERTNNYLQRAFTICGQVSVRPNYVAGHPCMTIHTHPTPYTTSKVNILLL
jgi:hypothetical protein